MKISALIIFTFLLPLAAYCQQGYKQDLKQIATITFPEKPNSGVRNGKTIYALNRNDTIYAATISTVNKDFHALEKNISADSIFSEIITGMLTDSGSNLIYRQPIKVNGLKGVEFAYVTMFDLQNADQNNQVVYFSGTERSYRYYQVFYVKNTVISLGYWSKDPLRGDDKGMRAFFKSFKLIPKPTDSNLAYNIGKGIGYVLIAGVIALLGFGTVYLLRKFS